MDRRDLAYEEPYLVLDERNCLLKVRYLKETQHKNFCSQEWKSVLHTRFMCVCMWVGGGVRMLSSHPHSDTCQT